MSYHAVAVEREWSAVDPNFQILILALMKVAGGAWLATAGAMIVLLFKPFREGERWALWAIPAVGLTVTATSLYVTLYVAANTSATPHQRHRRQQAPMNRFENPYPVVASVPMIRISGAESVEGDLLTHALVVRVLLVM
ncbi:MAG: hypothetical protein SAK29_29460 [Scytonema sp. PMC 1069.18]|nr:hypothetical protein [Scytonema sp. PMC 1069.18]MEC4886042.1 hypothetical protein [Scytonema sp. PMC 1070.18]